MVLTTTRTLTTFLLSSLWSQFLRIDREKKQSTACVQQFFSSKISFTLWDQLYLQVASLPTAFDCQRERAGDKRGLELQAVARHVEPGAPHTGVRFNIQLAVSSDLSAAVSCDCQQLWYSLLLCAISQAFTQDILGLSEGTKPMDIITEQLSAILT